MTVDDLAYLSATRLRDLVRSRKVSPVEVVDYFFGRIERINPAINAFCTLAPEQARAAARRAEAAMRAGAALGPLHGVPVAIKDLTATAGIRTTYGSKLFEHNVPTEDALVVARLKAAGAIVLGKTNTPEFGAGINTTNAVFGPTRNPWDTNRSSGGSSGGSAAALAAGLCPIAEGTDHGGSLRVPAALCGVIGFRTTAGRVPRYPSGWLYDTFSVTGPMARTVPDVALMLSVVAGPDDRVPIAIDTPGAVFADAAQGDVAGLRVAWSRDLGLSLVDPEVADIAARAARSFADLGCHVVEGHPDVHDVPEMIPPLRAMRNVAATPHLLDRVQEIDNPFCREYLERGRSVTALEVARAEAQRSALYQRCRDFFQRHDLLLTPTMPVAAFPIEDFHPRTIAGRPVAGTLDAVMLTYAITMTGLPAISVPCGRTAEGLPVGLQIVGGWHAEALVLRTAAAFERARDQAEGWQFPDVS